MSILVGSVINFVLIEFFAKRRLVKSRHSDRNNKEVVE